MPRDGTETYVLPFPDVEEDTTIESAVYNGFTNDVAADLNTPRPIKFGGTGANTPEGAIDNLNGELKEQVVTNYNSSVFVAGSFYSAAGATAPPVDGHAFTGICYVRDTGNMFIEASDQDDSTQPGSKYIRQKKAGVWSVWQKIAGVSTGTTPPAAAGDNALWWDPTLGKLFVYYNDGNTKQWVETNAVPDVDPNTYVEISGDAMTGFLSLNGNATSALHAVPKQQLDTALTALRKGYLFGAAITPSPSSISVTAGAATDTANTAVMECAALVKNAAAWVVGSAAGGLDTGSMPAATATWFHVYMIQRPDTGVTDICFSTSISAPTFGANIPSAYTRYRRIGSVWWTLGNQFLGYTQIGDYFYWTQSPALDFSSTITTARTTITSLAPPNTLALLRVYIWHASGACNIVLQPILETDAGPSTTATPLVSLYSETTSQGAAGEFEIPLNASSQLAARANGATTQVRMLTKGWIDRRGRDA
jgi:hypothetical protein